MIPVAGAGAVMVIVPVATVQFGCCVTLAVGAAGVNGTVLTVRLRGAETQPVPFFTVTLYVLGARLLKIPVVFV